MNAPTTKCISPTWFPWSFRRGATRVKTRRSRSYRRYLAWRPVFKSLKLSKRYLAHRLMPRQDLRDAFHLAFASYYKLEFLLTWNCEHLANARKQRHIRTVNALLSLGSPLVTPLELVLVEHEEDA